VNEALYTLLGTILGGSIVILNTYLTNKANIKSEKIRMFGEARIEAYKNLLHFSENILGDPSDDMTRDFLYTMKAGFYKKIFPNYLYYPTNIRKLLAELKSQYDCWGHPDCFDREDGERFLTNRLNDIAQELQDLTIKEAGL